MEILKNEIEKLYYLSNKYFKKINKFKTIFILYLFYTFVSLYLFFVFKFFFSTKFFFSQFKKFGKKNIRKNFKEIYNILKKTLFFHK